MSHICLGIPSALFSKYFPTKTSYSFLISPVGYMSHTTQPAWFNQSKNVKMTFYTTMILFLRISPLKCPILSFQTQLDFFIHKQLNPYNVINIIPTNAFAIIIKTLMHGMENFKPVALPRGGFGVFKPPPPPKFRRHFKKLCQTQPDCENY